MKSLLLLVVLGAIVGWPAAGAGAQSVPALINYQGRLTDPSAAPLPTGNYGIEFRLWDSSSDATGLVWGQRQNVSVLANGVFNVILGAPGGNAIAGAATNDLAFAFTSSNRFLGLTIVSSNGVPQAVGEIVPRQQLLSAPYSLRADTAAKVDLQSITSASIRTGAVTTAALAVGAVTLTNLAARLRSTNADVGGIAISASTGLFPSNNFTSTVVADVPNLQVTIRTSGRPVMVSLGAQTNGNPVAVDVYAANGDFPFGKFVFWRDGASLTTIEAGRDDNTVGNIEFPPSAFSFIDFPPAGEHVYKLRASVRSSGVAIAFFECVLIAYEL